jgi:hypothetical protein
MNEQQKKVIPKKQYNVFIMHRKHLSMPRFAQNKYEKDEDPEIKKYRRILEWF